MNKRERERFGKQMAAHNAEVRAAHARERAEILALRPGWDAAKLEAVRHSYGTTDGLPGLSDLLGLLRQHDALAAKFGGVL